MQHVAMNPVTGGRRNVSECNVFSAEIGQRLHWAVGCGDDQRLEGRTVVVHWLCEGLDSCSFSSKHIGDRAEISDVDAAESERLARRAIVRADDELDRHLKMVLEIGA